MASARELDTDPNVYIGVSLPIKPSVQIPFFKSTKTNLEQAKSNIKNLLLTSPGERVGNPAFGSNFKGLLFEQYTEELEESVRSEIQESLETWLPHIDLQEVTIVQNERIPNQINVSLTFSLSYEPEKTETVGLSITETSAGASVGTQY